MQFLNARSEDANPLFRPAEVDDVSHVKVPADGGTLELVHVARCLQRAEEKVIPNVFDRNLHAELFGKRNRFANLSLRTAISFVVADFFSDHTRYEEHGAGAVPLRIPQSLL